MGETAAAAATATTRGPLAHSLCAVRRGSAATAECSTEQLEGGKRVVLLVGGLGFLSSRLAAQLGATGDEADRVQIVAHSHDIGSDDLLWYRKEQLHDLGLEVSFKNLSDYPTVEKLVNSSRPKTVVFIPPGVDEDESVKADWSKYLEEFVLLLEALRIHSPCTRVLLASTSQPSHDPTVLQAWMATFELALATYHNIYSTPMTVLRVSGGVYGPWSSSALRHLSQWQLGKAPHSEWCCYVSDVTNALSKAIRLNSECDVLDLSNCREIAVYNERDAAFAASQTHNEGYHYTVKVLNITSDLVSLETGSELAMKWAASYAQHTHQHLRDRVLTSYFTSAVDSQRNRHKAPNTFQYIQDWFQSVKKLGLKAVIFHDGLDAQFQHRLTQHYSGVEFYRVESLRNRSTNDARFYSYLSYISQHTDINRVLLTDVSDVRFQKNPFELFDLLDDPTLLYIGTDIDIFPSMATMPWISTRLENCFGEYSVREGSLHALMHLDTVYNAGIIGGHRNTILEVLHRIVELLDSTPSDHNCNMPAVNYAVHKHFYDRVFTGFPLNSRFLRQQATPKGVYIVHK